MSERVRHEILCHRIGKSGVAVIRECMMIGW